MAIQSLRRGQSLGQLLGTGLGSGLSGGLQLLAKQKLGQLAERQQTQRTQGALDLLLSGDPQKVSQGVSLLPQNMQVEYIKNMRRQQQQQALSQLLGGGVPPEPGAPVEGAPGGVVPGQPGAPTGGVMPGVGAPAGPGVPPQQQGLVDAFGGADIPLQQQVQLAGMAQQKELAEKKLVQQRELAGEKISAREQEQIDKETLKAYESYSTAAEDARNKIPLVKEFINISLQGDPGSPASNTMREVLGNFAFGKDVPKDWLYTDNATIQRKLSAQLVKLTLEKMEGRKSVEVLKAIQRTFPNVYQNRGAQLAIAKTLLYEYNMNDLKDRLQDRIIEENNGRRPRNLKSLVEKLARRLEPSMAKKYLPNIGG